MWSIADQERDFELQGKIYMYIHVHVHNVCAMYMYMGMLHSYFVCSTKSQI